MIRLLQKILARAGRDPREVPTEPNYNTASIPAIVLASRPPKLANLEQRQAIAHADLADVRRRLAIESEAANPAFSNLTKVKNPATMALARDQAAQLTARAAEIDATLVELRQQIAAAKASSGVAEALAPLRRQAAQDVATSVRALYAAIARYNETSAAIERENGKPAFTAPVSFPIVDHILQKIAAVD